MNSKPPEDPLNDETVDIPYEERDLVEEDRRRELIDSLSEDELLKELGF